LEKIDPKLAAGLEFEFLIRFPHVVRELEKRGVEVKAENAREKIEMNY
jgi:hypothetical protein